jgi:putative PEP-CTERM system histidine kinase
MLLRDKHATIHRVFAIGMLLLAAEEVSRGLGYRAILPGDVIYWQKRAIAFSALVPGVWLAFSIGYARVNAEASLSRWKWLLGAVSVAPVMFVIASRTLLVTGYPHLEGAARWVLLFGWPGRVLQCFILAGSILIVFNLERTLRSSIGRMRWQIKFIALGVQGLFALRIYLASQALLFGNLDTGLGAINAVALIAADLLFAISLARGRLLKGDVYLSTAGITNSFTIILAGVYLLAVGMLARVVRYIVPSDSLPLDAFIVFLALTALCVLLLSNRLRHRLLLFITRHFRRPVYDYRSVWMELTQRTTSLLDVHELSNAIAKIVSESLDILSVNVWILDETQQRLTLAGSTSLSSTQSGELEGEGKSAPEFIRFVRQHKTVIDLNDKSFEWPKQVMQAGDMFRQSAIRYAIGLRAGGELVGVMTLNDDRIGGEDLASEDCVLLETLTSELAASLLNLKLSARLRQAGEVEAFQTVSTFFVHDLKNLASRLSLTMENLPQHFEDPQFRDDALRVISGSLAKIDDMCSRLSMLKRTVELNIAECDIQQLVASTLDEFKPNLKATLEPDLEAVPKALADREQMHKVLTNLVLNANEAVNGHGVIRVATVHEGDTVGFAVKDNGCGMSQDFIEKSLFRPFQTTKKKGLGIGLFHTKLIVEAHRGKIEVSSKPGQGTEFRVVLPVA